MLRKKKKNWLRNRITETNDTFAVNARSVVNQVTIGGRKYADKKSLLCHVVDYFDDDYEQGRSPASICVDRVVNMNEKGKQKEKEKESHYQSIDNSRKWKQNVNPNDTAVMNIIQMYQEMILKSEPVVVVNIF